MVVFGDVQTILNASLHIIRNIRSTINKLDLLHTHLHAIDIEKEMSLTSNGQSHTNSISFPLSRGIKRNNRFKFIC